MGVLLIVGSEKGAFLVRADEARVRWRVEGPVFKGWRVTAVARDARGRYYLGVASPVYGPTIQLSDDLAQWRQAPGGPAYPEGGTRKLTQIWQINTEGPTLRAGVAEAGLFTSDDRGETWKPVAALNDHPTRGAWLPGAGGLCAHAILTDRRNPRRLWCGISAVGVFRTEDGGGSWQPRNQGVQITIEDKVHKDVGY